MEIVYDVISDYTQEGTGGIIMRKRTVTTIIMWVAVIAVFSLFMKPTSNVSCAAGDGELLMTSRSGYELTVVYDAITSVEYFEEMDYGTAVDGTDDKYEKSGLWESDGLGQYLICTNSKVEPCIVIHADEQVMVINYESEKTTSTLYEAILEQTE